jgi:hypothetical protein
LHDGGETKISQYISEARKESTVSFKDRWLREKLKKKAQKGFRGYPIATIAHYGPNDQHATKVVVSIIRTEGGEPELMTKWHSATTDVRADARINEEITQFIAAHAPRSVIAVDRIIGCPHEEGIDYLEGEKCPQCSFWATRDRWSGEVRH